MHFGMYIGLPRPKGFSVKLKFIIERLFLRCQKIINLRELNLPVLCLVQKKLKIKTCNPLNSLPAFTKLPPPKVLGKTVIIIS